MPLSAHVRRCALSAWLLLSVAGAAQAACSVQATPLAFGNYSPVSTSPTQSVGTVTVRCATLLGLNLSYTIALSAGMSGNPGNRYLSSGSANLRYQLYQDAAGSIPWGDGSSGTTPLTDRQLLVLLGTGKSYSIYGRIMARQNVPPGTYQDTIVVTVTY
ncbi:Csu type fimbrial protein [Roseomonas populi]|uniref:Spore coat U domain-containing protein n=1 Tax=Roseomonas populi TaxID=3121582 RepID=A0ABT1X3K7_9PROT|nr:spore coat U domain-containing protein [Roseomonas pecuniae]MCR0982680.1 spore coat U domain-containing protein [Roseomonas pecuniae]